jgi:hypothetical protein
MFGQPMESQMMKSALETDNNITYRKNKLEIALNGKVA